MIGFGVKPPREIHQSMIDIGIINSSTNPNLETPPESIQIYDPESSRVTEF